ncbi:hypothetical protein GCM10010988_03870 [Cnuibacter physcomitrellae]|uniref:hypothetical protein n=1 Tax=Cnuibacter physcomitrellae TaxID=1619308 RepID=UPI00198A862E|nr:hypothetical protein [Cnuibacter physcomitrellae]GGI35427.1 hypothetical protein GCM10010988_03870 [Cnuibacter physcomitrellae]
MRKSLALVLSAGLLVGLAACSSPSTPDCTGAATSGPASEGIDVTGDFGKAPTVTFGTPLDSTDVQRTILTQGDGPQTGEGGTVLVDYSVYNAETGEQVAGTSYQEGAQQLWTLTQQGAPAPGLDSALACVNAGSRVALTLPADSDAQTPAFVLVVDVDATYPRAASGGDVPAVAGFPSVVHDDTGRPGITVVSGTDETTFRSTALKKGDGPEVQDGDTLLVQFTSVNMDTKKVAASTWEKGSTQALSAKSNDDPSISGVEKISDAMVGANVGDEIIAVVPADAASSSANASQAASVYVIDILGILPAGLQIQQQR